MENRKQASPRKTSASEAESRETTLCCWSSRADAACELCFDASLSLPACSAARCFNEHYLHATESRPKLTTMHTREVIEKPDAMIISSKEVMILLLCVRLQRRRKRGRGRAAAPDGTLQGASFEGRNLEFGILK